MLKVSLTKPITLIINQMLNTGIFPDKLNIAKVIPIYKKDDKTLFTNYRPISLLPTISKIFEKVIFKQICSFFQEKKMFYNGQYGFRTEHSTEYAALELIDRVILEIDKKNTPINVFVDLEKLKYNGIDGIALKLIERYMTNRTQYVEIDVVKSAFLPGAINVIEW